jgi:Zn-dependent M28 family amino/carboxypeptidase
LKKTLLLALAALCAPGGAGAQSPAAPADGRSWWEHVKVLADDRMEGRQTGSPGLRAAEAYVVDVLRKAGLEPAGEGGGWYQTVKLESRRIVEKESSAALVRGGDTTPLALGEDCFFGTRTPLAPTLEAPLVFAGYGLRVPEKGYDDLASLDLAGKVAVILRGSPAEIPGPLAAHYQTTAERWKAFRAAGAVGLVMVPNPAAMDIPWPRMALSRTQPSMELADPAFQEAEGAKLAMAWNPARADLLFEGTGHAFSEIAALAREGKRLPRFALGRSIRTRTRVEKEPVESANVVARLPGRDPVLRAQSVVLSAHVDHVGVGEPVAGDRIYNGAMDNASGTAVLLDVATALAKADPGPRRSVLFVFVTAEEKGLLGSKYFADRPTVDPASLVADVNVDMFLPILPLRTLTVWGLEESDLGDAARAAAGRQGVSVQNDPEPQRNIFIRSDQYNFIRHGIPALMMGIAPSPGSKAEAELFQGWLSHRYHAPSDDLLQPVDLSAAARYEDLVRSLVVDVADADVAPRWKPDSFFRRYAPAAPAR